MSDEENLIRAIQADPDQDTPRLMYADWLEEFGTTDQHRARVEWIRFTCDDRSRWAQKPTGKRVRKPGERPWLEKNLHRLWPKLFAAATATGRMASWQIKLVTGGLEFHIPLRVQSDLTETPFLDSSIVTLRAARGVATLGSVSFLRGAHTAPLIAADEPLVPIRFFDLPSRAYTVIEQPARVNVWRDPFIRRGLKGVWDRLPFESISGYGKWIKRTNEVDPLLDVRGPLSEALTEWAREQAKPTEVTASEEASGGTKLA